MKAGVNSHRSNIAAGEMKRWEEPRTPEFLLGIFILWKLFWWRGSASGHSFDSLCKHHCLLFPISFFNLPYLLIRSNRNCHTGSELYSHVPCYHVCDILSKHLIWIRVQNSPLLQSRNNLATLLMTTK